MSKLSLSVYLNAYNDRHPSNNPNRSDFKWARELNSIVCANANSQSAQIAPGETLQLFMGMRTLAQDLTTEYSISLLPGTSNTYVLTAVGGTLPNFRTPRVTGADATTQISTSMNGPLETFTSGPGTFAQFIGQSAGMLSPVTITANVIGAAGNAVTLIGNGSSSVSALITAWNLANPGNQVTLTTGNGNQVPNAPIYAFFAGLIEGTGTDVTITALNSGTVGNSAVLIGDGVSSISVLIYNWNLANPSNKITLPTAFVIDTVDAPNITFTAVYGGAAGNSISLVFDGIMDVATVVGNWNTANPTNTVSYTGLGTVVPVANTWTLADGNYDGTQIPYGGERAFYTGVGFPATPSFTSVTITADNYSENGNDIELIGDGVSSIDTLIANWNAANPTNTASLTSGLGGQIPMFGGLFTLANGQNPAVVNLAGGVNGTIYLTGGTNATLLNLIVGGVVVGDYVTIGAPFAPLNQGTFQILALTATSFTVNNPTGAAQGPVTLGPTFASELQIYGAAGVQVKDILAITGGFSPITQNSYEITAVFANSLQFYSNTILPIEGPITTDDIIIYSSAKTLVYMESDSALSVSVNGTVVGTIEPFVIPNAHQPSFPPQIIPGPFMMKSVIYSLSVTNNGVNPANMFFAAVE